jgi:transcriptional regulator GlxA family with amidase domain
VRTVLIALFDGVQSLDVTGPLEVFAGARDHQGKRAYRVQTASLGGAQVRTSSGLVIVPDGDLRDQGHPDPPDLLIVPGGRGARRVDPDLVGWIRARAPRAKRVASVCTGAFLLAEAGLLDGRRATTHWSYCDALRDQYPAVKVDPEPIFIKDGAVATSAGVTAGIDLALALVEDDLGRDMALASPVPSSCSCAARAARPSSAPSCPPR